MCFERMLTIIIYIPDADNVGSYRRIRMGCREIVQLGCLIITMVTSIVSCVSPYWITDKQGDELYHEGLWTRCPRDGCDWFHKDWLMLQEYYPGMFHDFVAFLLNVLENNFSVMSGRSHYFLGITTTFWKVNVSCSRTKHGDLSEDRTPDLSLRSPTLYHYATAPPLCSMNTMKAY